MKFLVDMNLSPRWVAVLNSAGFDATHWSAIGRADAKDSEIMAWAADNSFVVLTHDLDFSAILAATEHTRPSVVQIRADDVSPEALGTKVVAALLKAEPDLDEGALLSVEVDRARLRLLPLSRRP